MTIRNYKREFAAETVAEYRPYVTVIAQSLAKKLPEHVDFDELVQWGMLGLVDALEKWDPNRNNKFKTYAEFRIRGAILDGLRGADIVSRSVRERQKKIEHARRSVELNKGRAAMPFEIADELGMELSEYLKFLKAAQGAAELSMFHDDIFTPEDRQALLVSTQNKSGDITEKLAARQKLEQFLVGLTNVDRACLLLYYVWGLTMNEIGELFDCTESRISQRIQRVQSYNVARGRVNGE